MRRRPIAAAIGAVVAGTGVAHATDYLLNFDPAPISFAQYFPGHESAGGYVTFPIVSLYLGDTLTLDLDFGFPLASFGGQYRYGFNYGINPGTVGYLSLSYGQSPPQFCSPDIFCATTQAIQSVGNVGPVNGNFYVSSFYYAFIQAPEPSSWFFMLAGSSLIGMVLRRRRLRREPGERAKLPAAL